MSTIGKIEITRRPGCPGCGAVLSLPVSGEYVRCPECLQQLRIPQEARVVESLPCVACSGHMLAYTCRQGELIIDFCSGCEGFWFDGGELQRLVQQPALLETFQLPPRGQRPSAPVQGSHWRNCPRCQGRKLSSTQLGDVTLDVCHQCRGSWLDAGELQRLSELHRASPEPEPEAREHWLRQWVSQALRLLGRA